MKTLTLMAAALAAALLPSIAKADSIALSLSAPVRTVSTSGATLSFSGTVTNTSSATEYFNADNLSFSMGQNAYTFDDTSFFNNLFSLAPNESYTGELFRVVLSNGLMVGNYFGTYSLLGGTSSLGDEYNTLGSANLQVNVAAPVSAATPEPSSLLLLGTGALSLAGMARRRFAR